MRKAALEQDKALKAHKEECDKECDRKKKQLDIESANLARGGAENHELLKAMWLKQFTESQMIIQFPGGQGHAGSVSWYGDSRTVSKKRPRLSRS